MNKENFSYEKLAEQSKQKRRMQELAGIQRESTDNYQTDVETVTNAIDKLILKIETKHSNDE